MERCMIVAIGDKNEIGVKGNLPWHISEDLKFFKRTTMGCPVIMGRKTYDSIGRPLPGRLNIVVSRGVKEIEGCTVVTSLADAFSAAEGAEKCFIMGGASIYAAAMDMVDKLYITHVHTTIPEADAFFPSLDPTVWQRAEESGMLTDGPSGVEYEFVTYTRV